MQVNGKNVSNERLAYVTSLIKPHADAMADAPTEFELITAIAFVLFALEECEIVILEAGMGGRLDSTNVIEQSVLSVITGVALEHTEYLGDTIEKIATTKSKTIKADCESGVTVVSAQDETAIRVIGAEAARQGTRLVVPKEAVMEGTEEIYEIISYGGMKGLRLGLGGIYQIQNACTAIECALSLGLSEEAIRKGLASAKNPARFEMIGADPVTIYDGGHNPNGVRSLKASLDRYYPNTKRTVVFACMADKDFMPSLDMLNDGYSSFVFTTVQDNPRAMGAKALAEKAAENGIFGEWAPNLKEALKIARAKGNLTLACGSLYLYKDL
jgi:dihydrofolate synthase/folylpolyglutamate synthase